MDIILASNREDGRIDLEGIGSIGAKNLVFLSQADGTYQTIQVGTAEFTHDVAVADFDGDGFVEIIDLSFHHPNTAYEIDFQGNWHDDTDTFSDLSGLSAHRTDVFDFNGDGCPDFFAVDNFELYGAFSYFESDCDGGFTRELSIGGGTELLTVPGWSWEGLDTVFNYTVVDGQWIVQPGVNESVSADFNNDGLMDMLFFLGGSTPPAEDIANNYLCQCRLPNTNQPILLTNTGNGFDISYDAIPAFHASVSIDGTSARDVNADGRIDIVIRSIPGDLVDNLIYLNAGHGKFVKIEGGLFDQAVVNFIPVDIDNDGKLEFVAESHDAFRLFTVQNMPQIELP